MWKSPKSGTHYALGTSSSRCGRLHYCFPGVENAGGNGPPPPPRRAPWKTPPPRQAAKPERPFRHVKPSKTQSFPTVTFFVFFFFLLFILRICKEKITFLWLGSTLCMRGAFAFRWTHIVSYYTVGTQNMISTVMHFAVIVVLGVHRKDTSLIKKSIYTNFPPYIFHF